MFYAVPNFNQDLNHWDVSNVNNMGLLFHGASSFNGDISNWDVSNVTNMDRMFYGASNFNIPLSGWADKLDNVSNMNNMFHNASSYNQDLSSRCLSGVSHNNFNTNAPFASEPDWQPTWNGICGDFPQLELIGDDNLILEWSSHDKPFVREDPGAMWTESDGTTGTVYTPLHEANILYGE